MTEVLDCLVVGGGPAGLTAAIYLGRFRRRVRLIDDGDSRATWIPRSHNLPGFPDGVEGTRLLEAMAEQARRYGATLERGRVDSLARRADGLFQAVIGGEAASARTAILATGVRENEPNLPDVLGAVKRGLIRVCPICDAFEAMGERIAILGDSDHAAGEALFLRTYSREVTLVLVGEGDPLSDPRRRALADAGVQVIRTRIERVSIKDLQVQAICDRDDVRHTFDVVYSAFGTTAQSALADRLGARLDDRQRLEVGDHQETSVRNLYAVGDLVRSLNQISVATGEAAVAATAIHNRLAPNLD